MYTLNKYLEILSVLICIYICLILHESTDIQNVNQYKREFITD